ncbi:cytochrome c-type biogenesis protein CcmH [Stappia sp. GBMRC 2046]|uniref:Cytochrome c-type biogenesis protein n=2 Tax=Stappia sediminis TaxID=2692190 RepID=A0A7X3LV94_9HYPH|nr:cytochrome c-type biogenesis protein [Stappia sediminis]MXN65688.1 cytochrome c-type biogenesis protein CcmH [Stappia sediminis]
MGMRVPALLLGALLMVFAASGVRAVEPDEVLDDPKLEMRARELSAELRCMVCQNQSIDDSDAPLAKDLRILVRERLKAGDSDRQVLNYLVDRYGEFVLLKPRLALHTLFLWGLPPLALLGGGLAIFLAWKRRKRDSGGEAKPTPLSADEERELKRILDEGAS